MDEVAETVQVVVDGFPALVIGRSLQDIDRLGFLVERGKVFVEFIFEAGPLSEAKFTLFRLQFELTGCPLACSVSLHVRHCPDDLLNLIVEGFWTEADISATRSEKGDW